MSTERPSTDNDISPPTADRRALLAGIGGLAAGALLAGTRPAQAGPLTPPAGPVGSTGRTTQEIFDAVTTESRRGWIPLSAATTPGVPTESTFLITQPGAYYLTGPVNAGANARAIEIAAPNVTLDLNGQRVSAAGAGKRAIFASNFLLGRRVFNGIVAADTGATAIYFMADSGLLEDLVIHGNQAATLVSLDGSYGATVRRLRLWPGGGGQAIAALSGSRDVVVEDVSVSTGGNFATGITLDARSIVRRCTVNRPDGVGIQVGEGGLVEQCHVAGSISGSGILVGDRSSVVDCVVDRCGAFGIAAGFQSLVERCRSTTNATGGVRVGEASAVRNCYVEFHPASPQFGIKAVGNNVQVLDNVISRCGIGIDLGGVSGCVAFRNTLRLCPNAVAVSFGGNWYPFVDFGGLNTATNPFANLFTNA